VVSHRVGIAKGSVGIPLMSFARAGAVKNLKSTFAPQPVVWQLHKQN
jgi:hypothetical protein